jgi:hypothetical protein
MVNLPEGLSNVTAASLGNIKRTSASGRTLAASRKLDTTNVANSLFGRSTCFSLQTHALRADVCLTAKCQVHE